MGFEPGIDEPAQVRSPPARRLDSVERSHTFGAMSAPDRSWTIAPTLGWFVVVLVVCVWQLDGDLDALAGRLTTARDADAVAPAGPGFTPAPTRVADARADRDERDEPGRARPVVTGDRRKGGALEDTCLEGTDAACRRWAMDAFYKAIAAEQAGSLARPVRVSWYGDSVVATDALPSRLRTRLQAELGDGGPGFVYLVAPHRFCAHEAVSRSHTGTWRTHAISTQQTADRLYGAGGASAESSNGKATLKLGAGAVSRIGLHYLAQPGGGTVTVSADGRAVLEVATAAEPKVPAVADGVATPPAKQIVVAVSGRARVFGVTLENDSGAVVDNFGIVSVNVKSFANHDPDHHARTLVQRGADLLMVMIGANEAQWLKPGDHDTKHYAANYEKVLRALRAARPDASCLVVSPTDQAEASDSGYTSRAVMPVLIDAQRAAAVASGCAFFSTYDWMGGKGSAAKWFKKGYVGSDFQHLSRKGGNKMADALFDALIGGYRQHGTR